MATSAFPLRIRTPRLRELVRAVAEREGISQNELLEQAAEHEVIARGALLADELEASAQHLRALTSTTMADRIAQSIDAFVAAEAMADPIRPRQITRDTRTMPGSPGLGAVAAFTRS